MKCGSWRLMEFSVVHTHNNSMLLPLILVCSSLENVSRSYFVGNSNRLDTLSFWRQKSIVLFFLSTQGYGYKTHLSTHRVKIPSFLLLLVLFFLMLEIFLFLPCSKSVSCRGMHLDFSSFCSNQHALSRCGARRRGCNSTAPHLDVSFHFTQCFPSSIFLSLLLCS